LVALLFLQFLATGIYGGLTTVISRDFGTSIVFPQITDTRPFTWATRNLADAYNRCEVIIGLNSVHSVVQSISAVAGVWIAVSIQRTIVSSTRTPFP
jgi:hypothetical protein